MIYSTASAFAKDQPKIPAGPVAIVLCETDRHALASMQRLADQGAAAIIAVGAYGTAVPDCPLIRIEQAPHRRDLRGILNTLFRALAGRWLLWLWNGEFLVFPFCETRSLRDMATFLGDERRLSLYSYTLDLYAHPLPAPADPPPASALYFDRIGYHAFPMQDQQLRLYGGLGWRFEELTPPTMQQIGRAVMLKPGPETMLDRDMLFSDPVYDTVSCPWHHSPTAAVMSLHRTRRIMGHPGFPDVAHKLMWQGSTRFEWTSRQLLDLGMIEPGQWF